MGAIWVPAKERVLSVILRGSRLGRAVERRLKRPVVQGIRIDHLASKRYMEDAEEPAVTDG